MCVACCGQKLRERDKDVPNKAVLIGLGVVTMGMVCFTMWTVWKRFRRSSSDVFVSEV